MRRSVHPTQVHRRPRPASWPVAAASVTLAALLAACGLPPVRPPITAAARADAAAAALQANFYENGRYAGASFWQNAQGLAVVLDEYQRTHAAGWKADIAQIYRANAQGRPGNYRASYVDDEGWWAVDWIRAWDLTGDPAYLTSAKQIFAHMASDWGGDCGGGVYWNHSDTYKNAIPNELFLEVAVLLHEVTPGDSGSGSYLAWAEREADWFLGSGMINAAGLVNDGLTPGCTNNGQTTWTYNQGVILAGLAELSRVTGDPRYLDSAERIAGAAVRVLVTSGGVVYERGCEPQGSCGADGALFKGIFVTNLWWLYRYDPNPAFLRVLQATSASIWTQDRTQADTFGLHFAGPAPDPVLVTVQQDISAAMALAATATPLPTPARRS